MKNRWLWSLTLGVGLVVTGCGGEDDGPLSEGCHSDDGIPPGIRAELNAAAGEFFDRVRAGRWEEIYANVASSIREQRSPEEFLTPIGRFVQQVGLPEDLELISTTVVRFGPSFPHGTPLECSTGEGSPPFFLLLVDYPAQASLVHVGKLQDDRFFVSSLWYQDAGVWKVAGFFSKPASLAGKDWEDYAKVAAGQREAGNLRNAALLYNVAIDLVLPNAWTQPQELAALQRRQGRLNVTQLPVVSPEPWPAEHDTFKVYQSAYALIGSDLGVMFAYHTMAPLADSTRVTAYSDQLSRYVMTSFPEYPQVFDVLVLRAVNPEDTSQFVNHIYSLRSDE